MNRKSVRLIPWRHYRKYLLKHRLHRKLKKKIIKMKKQFAKKYEVPAQELKPHITLIEFKKLLGD